MPTNFLLAYENISPAAEYTANILRGGTKEAENSNLVIAVRFFGDWRGYFLGESPSVGNG
jgi:hypothetical protein